MNKFRLLHLGIHLDRLILKKPVVVEAFQMTGEHRESSVDWPQWLHEAWQKEKCVPNSLNVTIEESGEHKLWITTLEGVHTVSLNDWIIQGINGELYPCKPDIFEKTYERLFGPVRKK